MASSRDSVEAPIEAGASVNAKDMVTWMGRRYIVTGIMESSKDSVEARREAGVRVNARDKEI